MSFIFNVVTGGLWDAVDSFVLKKAGLYNGKELAKNVEYVMNRFDIMSETSVKENVGTGHGHEPAVSGPTLSYGGAQTSEKANKL